MCIIRWVDFAVAAAVAAALRGPLQVVSVARRICPDALVHADASQAMGKVAVQPVSLGVDLLTGEVQHQCSVCRDIRNAAAVAADAAAAVAAVAAASPAVAAA